MGIRLIAVLLAGWFSITSFAIAADSTPAVGQDGGTQAGRETIKSGITGDALREKERQRKKRKKVTRRHKTTPSQTEAPKAGR